MGVEGVDRVSYQEEAIQRRDGCVGEEPVNELSVIVSLFVV